MDKKSTKSRKSSKRAKSNPIKNRTIFTGDNLHIMRGMQNESVDLIYLDPPFNSKHNYAAPIGSKAAGAEFKDTWTLKDIDEAWWGEIQHDNPGLYKVLDAAGKVGSKSIKAYLIYMAIRILEMHRILKNTGSLYLHCDPTMSHYLKTVLDSIFNTSNFKNEIIWKRGTAHNDASRYGAIHDVIFFYVKSKDYNWNKMYTPYSQEYIDRYYKFDDDDGRGRFWTHDISAKGLQGGGYHFKYKGINIVWRFSETRIKELDADNRIYWPKKKSAMPKIKRYLNDAKGIPLQDLFLDVKSLAGFGANKNERLGYPTQKPIELLKRIIESSSNENDVVLDPFCGCATACSAAEVLDRKWIGIDISSKAYDLVKIRLRREAGLDKFTKGAGELVHRTDIPVRKGQRARDIKCILYGKQEGHCNGCRHWFEIRNFHIDHIIPTSKGGPDDNSNLQLLCGSCNSVKGNRTMAYLLSRLKELEIRS